MKGQVKREVKGQQVKGQQVKGQQVKPLFKPIANAKKYFKEMKNQREFMEGIYKRLEMKEMSEYLKITNYALTQYGGKSLLSNYYANNMQALLSSIFPHYPWEFHRLKVPSNTYFKSLENQRNFMENLFWKFEFVTIDRMIAKLTKKTIMKNGGKSLITFYYRNDLINLYLSVFPNYPHDFSVISGGKRSQSEEFERVDRQVEFLIDLYYKLKLQSVEEFARLSRKKIIQNGGKVLLSKCYANNIKSMCLSLLPHFPWGQFLSEQIPPQIYFNDVSNRRSFMDRLFIKLQYRSLDDFATISIKKIKLNGGNSLITSFYSNDLPRLFREIYPNFPFEFPEKVDQKEYFKERANQERFVMELMEKREMKGGLGDLLSLSKSHLLSLPGGRSLLSLFSFSPLLLFSSLFPHFPWPLPPPPPSSPLDDVITSEEAIERERREMKRLERRFGIEEAGDWLRVPRHQLLRHSSSRSLLLSYQYNFPLLLTSIYPSYSFSFEKMKFRCNFNEKTNENYRKKLCKLIDQFAIRKKQDWYRLPVKIIDRNIYKILKLVYSSEKWEKKNFQMRTKKTNQRRLFALVCSAFSQHLLYENYLHPLLLFDSNAMIEYDVFSPALNIAWEYQGEHHYNDIPSASSFVEIYKTRDRFKHHLSSLHHIRIISIPYWWDLSPSSLFSSFTLLPDINN